MKTKNAPTRLWKNPGERRPTRFREKTQAPVSALAAALLSVVCLMIFCANTVSAQNLRRRPRIQRRIDRQTPRPASDQNKLTPSTGAKEEPGASDQPEAERAATRQNGQNLEGIKQRGLPYLFAREELSLWIPGFANRAALLVIFRQLNLTPEQKVRIRDLRRRVGEQLRSARQEMNLLEAQLDEAIYGIDSESLDTYDPEKVKELTEQAIQKRAEWFRLQTDIESQFRQILTPDQFYVYRELVIQMLRPAGRPLGSPAARQRRQQLRMRAQPDSQNRPNQQDQ